MSFFLWQIIEHCKEAHGILIKEWASEASQLFITHKDTWVHLVPQNDNESTVQVYVYLYNTWLLSDL